MALTVLHLYTLHVATLPLCTLHIALRCSTRAAPPVPALQRKRTNYSSGSADFFTFAAHALLPLSSPSLLSQAPPRSTRLATIAAQRPKSAVGEAAGLGRKGYGVLPCGRATAGAAPRGDGHLPFSATNVLVRSAVVRDGSHCLLRGRQLPRAPLTCPKK